jgi:phage tail sheath protein FI
VYVEEVDAGPKPIEGVSTSTVGAVGVTERGPSSGKPELVTSMVDFQRKFGGILPEPDAAIVSKWALDQKEGGRWWQFALAVKGFFDNGGQRLYVKRAFASTATSSSARMGKGVASEVTADAAATQDQIRLRHLFGIQQTTQINLFSAGQPLASNPFTVTSYNGTDGSVRLDKPLGVEIKAGRDFADVIARSQEPLAAADETLIVKAKAVGVWGDSLIVRVRPSPGAVLKLLPDILIGDPKAKTNVSADTTDPNNPVTTIPVTAGTGAQFPTGARLVVLGREHEVTGSAADTIDLTPGIPAGRTWVKGTSIELLRRANDSANPSDTLSVQGAGQLYKDALVELDNGRAKQRLTVVSVTGLAVKLSANVTIQLQETHKLRVIELEVEATYAPNNIVEAVETFPNLRLKDDKSVSYVLTAVNTNSRLIEVALGNNNTPLTVALDQFPAVTRPPATDPHRLWAPLTGGLDNNAELTVDDFVGVDGGANKRTGIQALEDIDEVSICLVPGVWSTTVHSALIQHCELLKDRFAILDPRDGLSIEGIRETRETLDSKYAALYYPWLEVRDPSVRRNVYVSPSGHMAGIYARVDVERGVHKAPANEVIRGITKIAQDVTKREQDMLNPRGINALRFFPGRSNRVWGARTISSDSSWKYINVRRLFIYVEESIDEGTQWVVFEPNDEPLWARVRQTVTNFLTSVWRSGALQGATADEAFFVKCDRSTMTQDDIDNGRLICLIGIAPVKPAEFVIFRIQQKTLDLQAS